ncbi:DUF1642 domain-containing protein [Lactococcus lactis]|uniref:DUF1642 domain-containing protein n=1 Tax=Lactococcus lactis TaxID=1358 RepID=UPI003D0B1DBE
MTKFEEEFQLDLEELIDGVLDDEISDSTFDGEKTKFIEKYAQQALPVVPECVGKFVSGDENELSKADRIAYLLKSVQGDSYYLTEELPGDGTITVDEGQELYNWAICQHHETILKLWNGYTVEKPQLFRLKLNNTPISNYYLWLNQATGKVFVDKKFLDWTNHDNVKNIFTEQEIAKISDGAFVNNEAFELVPVEDGE